MLNYPSVLLVGVVCDNVLLVHGVGIKRLIGKLEGNSENTMWRDICLLPALSILLFLGLYAARLVFGLHITLLPLFLFFFSVVNYFFLSLIVRVLPRRARVKQFHVLAAAFDPVVWGVNLICLSRQCSIFYGIYFLVAGSVWYVVFSNLVSYNIKQLGNNNIPSCFKGAPVLLIYIGLFSLALYGFGGG
ncbi:MAG: hypothetical protein LBJ38_02540 [Oscillospiraceae bacterium]|nr:hypothetical protein [Oscillospiraceae bacterium]